MNHYSGTIIHEEPLYAIILARSINDDYQQFHLKIPISPAITLQSQEPSHLLHGIYHIKSFFAPVAFHNMAFNGSSVNRNNCMCCTFMGIEPIENNIKNYQYKLFSIHIADSLCYTAETNTTL